MNFMTKVQSGRKLLRSSFSVLMNHKKLMLFPIVVAMATLFILLFFLVPVALQPTGHGYAQPEHWKAVVESIITKDSLANTNAHSHVSLTPRATGFLAVLYFVSMFLATFFNVAFFHEIMIAFKGQDVSIRGGLRFAFSKIPAIFMWSLLAGLVGLFLKTLEEKVGLFGKIIIKLIGVTWSLASVFTIPIIVMEDVTNPLTMLRQSAQTIKKTWGESLVGYVGLAAGRVIVLLGFVAFTIVGVFVSSALNQLWIAWMAGVMSIIGIFVSSYFYSVANQVYLCALYVFASQGQVPAGFEREAMDMAWKIKKG